MHFLSHFSYILLLSAEQSERRFTGEMHIYIRITCVHTNSSKRWWTCIIILNNMYLCATPYGRRCKKLLNLISKISSLDWSKENSHFVFRVSVIAKVPSSSTKKPARFQLTSANATFVCTPAFHRIQLSPTELICMLNVTKCFHTRSPIPSTISLTLASLLGWCLLLCGSSCPYSSRWLTASVKSSFHNTSLLPYFFTFVVNVIVAVIGIIAIIKAICAVVALVALLLPS